MRNYADNGGIMVLTVRIVLTTFRFIYFTGPQGALTHHAGLDQAIRRRDTSCDKRSTLAVFGRLPLWQRDTRSNTAQTTLRM